MKTISIKKVKRTHDKLREILMKFNNPEYGDCIVDEIIWLFNFPTTIDVETKEVKPTKIIETRVYVIDTNISDCFVNDLEDTKFMDLAEEQGRVYTLQGFQEAFNLDEINSSIDAIRFISVTVSK